jgi:hypothetical protein
MIDDIVTRLRADCGCTEVTWCSDACIAADEIETLRRSQQTLKGQPLNWVHVAQRLVQYINDTGPRQFDGVLDALAYLDSLEAADGE